MGKPAITPGAIAIVVEYDVKPDQRRQFEALIRAHAQGTLADEEGCLHFDVLASRDGSGRMMVYEVYRDEAAYRLHNQSPRLPKVREDYKDMITGKRIIVAEVI